MASPTMLVGPWPVLRGLRVGDDRIQVGGLDLLAGRIRESVPIGAGFALMGTSLALLTAAVTTFFVLAFVELLALRMARVSPNLAASISNAVTTGVSTWRSASKTRRTRIHLGGHGETEWAVS